MAFKSFIIMGTLLVLANTGVQSYPVDSGQQLLSAPPGTFLLNRPITTEEVSNYQSYPNLRQNYLFPNLPIPSGILNTLASGFARFNTNLRSGYNADQEDNTPFIPAIFQPMPIISNLVTAGINNIPPGLLAQMANVLESNLFNQNLRSRISAFTAPLYTEALYPED